MKVQSYKSIHSYIKKSEDFLLLNEVSSNIFFEIIKEFQKKGIGIIWSANVYYERKIVLSSILTQSKCILLSEGTVEAVHQLKRYLSKKKIKYSGVSGPSCLVKVFFSSSIKIQHKKNLSLKNFTIFKTDKLDTSKLYVEDKNFSLKLVRKVDWPRARFWAIFFASEADPKLEQSAVVNLAKKMMISDQLFFLEKESIGSCGMIGIRRETMNYKVINLVFIPKEKRNSGYAKKMLKLLIKMIYKNDKKECLLFSDYENKKNLYESIGFTCSKKYSEMIIN